MRRSVPRRQHEQILAAEKLRHQQDLDKANAHTHDAQARIEALTADLARVKGERDQFRQDRDRVTEQAAKDAATAADVVDGLQQELKAARRPETEALRRRVAQLEKQYDDAVGLGSKLPADSRRWQPGYQDPKQATS